MGIAAIAKSFFSNDERVLKDRLKKLSGLPKQEKEAALGRVLHEICVKSAADFVQEELTRKDSPFRGLSRADFFHEVVIINFWIVDRLFQKKRTAVQDEIFNSYFSVFYHGKESDRSGLFDSVTGKYRVYYDSWNEHTGHHDIFGRKATEFIFGKKKGAPVAETSFWLISYTDKTMKTFGSLKKTIDSVAGQQAPSLQQKL